MPAAVRVAVELPVSGIDLLLEAITDPDAIVMLDDTMPFVEVDTTTIVDDPSARVMVALMI